MACGKSSLRRTHETDAIFDVIHALTMTWKRSRIIILSKHQLPGGCFELETRYGFKDFLFTMDCTNGVISWLHEITTVYLERFFENLILQGKNELKKRFCHIL